MKVDWQVYYDAAKKCHDLAAELRRADKPVHDAVKGACAGMAGDAPGCKQWGEKYDETARQTMQTCTNLADALTNYGYVLYANGYNYGIRNKSNPSPPRPDVHTMTEYKVTIPKSAADNGNGVKHNGDGGVKAFFDELVKLIISEFGKLPNGDVDKLAKASTTWQTFADHATITGAAATISGISALFDGMDDEANRQLIQDHFGTLRTGAENVATASLNIAAPVAEYQTGTIEASNAIKSAITTAEITAGVIVAGAVGLALLTFGGSLLAGAGGVGLAAEETITTIRTLYTASNLFKALGLVAATSTAVGVIKSFDHVPSLFAISTSLVEIIALKAHIDDDGSRPDPGKPQSKGKIDESEKQFDPNERKLADLLADEGKNVRAVKESTVPGERTADSTVDGVPTEFKHMDPGATNATVKNALNSAQGQADHTIIDARGSGLTQEEAQRGVSRYLGASPDKMSEIRIVGDGWEINWP
ncbi:hypothetical protein ACQP0C_08090 [Nocardia sp. CA-129566]|uniref:CdiA C-terminal domain-containing protein n=1 Tax=Nocardia sp. CA-129566 TaxID=3239976 RepID=UPI003D976497